LRCYQLARFWSHGLFLIFSCKHSDSHEPYHLATPQCWSAKTIIVYHIHNLVSLPCRVLQF
jgi:hypothetical protein